MDTPSPSAATDRKALAEHFETTRYVEPVTPFAVDEHGLPVAEPEPDDPDDE